MKNFTEKIIKKYGIWIVFGLLALIFVCLMNILLDAGGSDVHFSVAHETALLYKDRFICFKENDDDAGLYLLQDSNQELLYECSAAYSSCVYGNNLYAVVGIGNDIEQEQLIKINLEQDSVECHDMDKADYYGVVAEGGEGILSGSEGFYRFNMESLEVEPVELPDFSFMIELPVVTDFLTAFYLYQENGHYYYLRSYDNNEYLEYELFRNDDLYFSNTVDSVMKIKDNLVLYEDDVLSLYDFQKRMLLWAEDNCNDDGTSRAEQSVLDWIETRFINDDSFVSMGYVSEGSGRNLCYTGTRIVQYNWRTGVQQELMTEQEEEGITIREDGYVLLYNSADGSLYWKNASGEKRAAFDEAVELDRDKNKVFLCETHLFLFQSDDYSYDLNRIIELDF